MRVLVARAACGLLTLTLIIFSSMRPAVAQTQGEEPIAYVGHGAFFDNQGNEIRVTQAFVEKAQRWYREEMLAALTATQKRDFAAFEQQLDSGVPAQGQARLAARQRALEWLLAASPKHKNDDRIAGKLHALQAALTRPLPPE